jgi:hypothetical protein
MTAWLRCRVDQGMFSDEVAVTYPRAAKGWQKSVFVPSRCVRDDAVQVTMVQKDGDQFAVLPSARQDIVKVEAADIVA